MADRLSTTGKSKAMRRMERQTLVVQKVDPETLANRPRPRNADLTPAQREQIALTGTIATRFTR